MPGLVSRGLEGYPSSLGTEAWWRRDLPGDTGGIPSCRDLGCWRSARSISPLTGLGECVDLSVKQQTCCLPPVLRSGPQSQRTSAKGMFCFLTLPMCEAAQPSQPPAAPESGGQSVSPLTSAGRLQVCHVFLVSVGLGCMGTARAHSLGLLARVALPRTGECPATPRAAAPSLISPGHTPRATMCFGPPSLHPHSG